MTILLGVGLLHATLAHYLAGASLAELAHLTGALAVELGTVRGIPVADLLGGIQARVEAARAGESHRGAHLAERIAFSDALCRVVDEHDAMRALLREFAQRAVEVVDPSAASLIGRTRALLAEIDAA